MTPKPSRRALVALNGGPNGWTQRFDNIPNGPSFDTPFVLPQKKGIIFTGTSSFQAFSLPPVSRSYDFYISFDPALQYLTFSSTPPLGYVPPPIPLPNIEIDVFLQPQTSGNDDVSFAFTPTSNPLTVRFTATFAKNHLSVFGEKYPNPQFTYHIFITGFSDGTFQGTNVQFIVPQDLVFPPPSLGPSPPVESLRIAQVRHRSVGRLYVVG